MNVSSLSNRILALMLQANTPDTPPVPDGSGRLGQRPAKDEFVAPPGRKDPVNLGTELFQAEKHFKARTRIGYTSPLSPRDPGAMIGF